MLSHLVSQINRFARRSEGATFAEMAILVSLVLVVAIGAVLLLGSTSNDLFTTVGNFFS